MGSIRQAVIVMAKRPQAGPTKTRLCPPCTREQAALLAEAFLRDTVANLQRADCAEIVLAYTPSEAEDWFAAQFPGLARIPQPDGDLGTRMSAVLEAAWRLRLPEHSDAGRSQRCWCCTTERQPLPGPSASGPDCGR